MAELLQILLAEDAHDLFRLDRQPEATRRAYAEKCGVPLHELGM
jgi:hypothetical protein